MEAREHNLIKNLWQAEKVEKTIVRQVCTHLLVEPEVSEKLLPVNLPMKAHV